MKAILTSSPMTSGRGSSKRGVRSTISCTRYLTIHWKCDMKFIHVSLQPMVRLPKTILLQKQSFCSLTQSTHTQTQINNQAGVFVVWSNIHGVSLLLCHSVDRTIMQTLTASLLRVPQVLLISLIYIVERVNIQF